MKLLIVSDSHGAVSRLEALLEREPSDVLIHLGDGWQDAQRLLRRTSRLVPVSGDWDRAVAALKSQGKTAVVQVPGNCDGPVGAPAEQLLTLSGCRMLLCHGHTCGVKGGLHEAREIAQRLMLDGFFFGHTHRPLIDRQGRTLFLNPGSIGGSPRPTYALVTVKQGCLEGRSAWLEI